MLRTIRQSSDFYLAMQIRQQVGLVKIVEGVSNFGDVCYGMGELVMCARPHVLQYRGSNLPFSGQAAVLWINIICII